MDAILQNAILIIGVALCVIAALQLSLWTASTVMSRRQAGIMYRKSLDDFDLAIADQTEANVSAKADIELPASSPGTWNGLRTFLVQRLVRETTDTTSVYLRPVDGKPLPGFLPGQFLTFQLQLPDKTKPVVRCYSLSDSPNPDYYRCTIKRVTPPTDQPKLPPGVSSSFFNDALKENATLEVKAPSGGFHLDLSSDRPAVLLAGGIGVTPMVSMLKTVIDKQPSRKLVLFYGVANGASHAMSAELAGIVAKHDNIKIINCYSRPLAEDVVGQDYHVHSRVSAELLTQVLPSPDFEFYLCGPPEFMQTLYDGLINWGADDDSIHFESFGPASVRKARHARFGETNNDSEARIGAVQHRIKFETSGVSADWDGSCETILELAEEAGIQIESGCRSGSCGTCVTRIAGGKFQHIKEVSADLSENECLVCVAQPKTDMKIDA